MTNIYDDTKIKKCNDVTFATPYCDIKIGTTLSSETVNRLVNMFVIILNDMIYYYGNITNTDNNYNVLEIGSGNGYISNKIISSLSKKYVWYKTDALPHNVKEVEILRADNAVKNMEMKVFSSSNSSNSKWRCGYYFFKII